MRNIRRATTVDLPAIMTMFSQARTYMAAHGNPTQWGTDKPTQAQIEADIQTGQSYVCIENGALAATFCFFIGDDPTYLSLQGMWLNERPYGVVHRFTTGGARRGAGKFCLDWCFAQYTNLRIDTHANNLSMQRLIHKCGFQFCGICHASDGTERLAYQKSAD